MENQQDPSTLAAIDIGSSKVAIMVGAMDKDGLVRIVGFGKVEANGFRGGTIQNFEAAVASISAALREAQQTSQRKITKVAAALTAKHLYSLNNDGRVVLAGREVTSKDTEKAVRLAISVPRSVFHEPDDRVVAHVVKGFTIDKDTTLQEDPVGLRGNVLRAQLHLALGSASAVQNLVKCIQSAGLDIEGLILQPWASAAACLTPTDRELGAALLDFGAGSTNIACYQSGQIETTAVAPVGGSLFTNDIAASLGCSIADAEEIKLRYGHLVVGSEDRFEKIHFTYEPDGRPRQASAEDVVHILEPRAREVVRLLGRYYLEPGGWMEKAAAGIVLTGGVANLPGLEDIFQEELGLPVRIGRPSPVIAIQGCSSPQDATAVGVLLEMAHRRRRARRKVLVSGPMQQFRSWVRRIFVGDFSN